MKIIEKIKLIKRNMENKKKQQKYAVLKVKLKNWEETNDKRNK